ncbi:hypothetical protein ILYODFUR_022840 [Ilyodon furcidens]|uniref:Uncharacterized protein n=1 Tax=Ilyodon furcidens TaxID=33524 RepID=A0ABV0VG97_9TELE
MMKLCGNSFHSFIFYTTSSRVGHRGAGAYLQKSMGKRQDRSPIHHRATQRHTGQTTTHQLESPTNLTVRFLDCGRKPEYLVRTCKLHAERPLAGSQTQQPFFPYVYLTTYLGVV